MVLNTINKQYFQTEKLECFPCSLANLLVEMGENELAERVFNNYRNHSLVGKQGEMHIGTATKLVLDLTNGLYESTLLFPGFGADLEQATERFMPQRKEEILEIVKEETEAGRIKVIDKNTKYDPLALVHVYNAGMGHWIVNIGNGKIIDNGQIVEVPLPFLNSITLSVLKIKKT